MLCYAITCCSFHASTVVIFKSTIFHLLPRVCISIFIWVRKSILFKPVEMIMPKMQSFERIKFYMIPFILNVIELKIPLLQSILPLTSSSGERVSFIQFQHQIYHTELLNSKINKRIKTDKRMYTYTHARARARTHTTGTQTRGNVVHADVHEYTPIETG